MNKYANSQLSKLNTIKVSYFKNFLKVSMPHLCEICCILFRFICISVALLEQTLSLLELNVKENKLFFPIYINLGFWPIYGNWQDDVRILKKKKYNY